jgi:hypothetical protein
MGNKKKNVGRIPSRFIIRYRYRYAYITKMAEVSIIHHLASVTFFCHTRIRGTHPNTDPNKSNGRCIRCQARTGVSLGPASLVFSRVPHVAGRVDPIILPLGVGAPACTTMKRVYRDYQKHFFYCLNLRVQTVVSELTHQLTPQTYTH